MNRYIKYSVIFLIGLNVLITVLGFVSMHRSPYTGIVFLEPCGERGCTIGEVDEGSPAWLAGIVPGDVILDVNNMGLPPFTFTFDPMRLDSISNLRLFWESQQRFSASFSEGSPLNLLIWRGEQTVNINITPTGFPLRRIAGRLLLGYIGNWLFVLTGFFIVRTSVDKRAYLLFLYLAFSGIDSLSTCGITYRDLIYPVLSLRLLTYLNLIGMVIAPFLFLHFGLLFPKRKMVIERYPKIVIWIYCTAGTVLLINVLNMSDSIFLMTKGIYAVNILVVFLFLYDLFMEKDILYRRQVQWVVYGFSVVIIIKLTMVDMPFLIWGSPIISGDSIFILPVALMPIIGLAIAVTRYRLMDIEEVIDYTVIFGATILVLVGIEIGFMSLVAPYYADADGKFPYPSLLLVLVLVFIYMPIRNAIGKGVVRLFKRGAYKVEDEVQKFILSIGVCDYVPVLNKFTSFIKNLLGPSEILILKVCRDEQPTVITMNYHDPGHKSEHENNHPILPLDKEKMLMDIISIDAGGLCDYFNLHKCSAYGFELIGRGVLPEGFSREIHNAVFVPFFIGNDAHYIGVLFEKWNRLAYLKRDRQLLDTISADMSHILEAEDMKRVRVKMEENFRREREHVMKEMHDGLGSILTNITVASQVAGQVFDADVNKAKDMVGVIRSSSAEASDFLRAGLTILDNSGGDFGPVITHIRHRLGGMLETCGMNVNFEVGDGVEVLKTGAHVNLNIIRCVQEGFNNILKHSGASTVYIRFSRNGISNNGSVPMKVEIADDGSGFEWGRNKEAGGMGLRNITRRIEDLGGFFEIKTSVGKGTSLILTIPIG